MWPTGRSSTVVVGNAVHRHSNTVFMGRWPTRERQAIIWRGAPRPGCPRRFFLRHQNRRSSHFVTHTGDDHRRCRGVAACQVIMEPTTEVAVAHIGPQRPGPAYNLVFREICTNPRTPPSALARHIAAAPRAHPAPTLRSALAPSSLHPERHDPHRSRSTIPCTENRRCAPRGQQNPQVPAVEAKRNAQNS